MRSTVYVTVCAALAAAAAATPAVIPLPADPIVIHIGSRSNLTFSYNDTRPSEVGVLVWYEVAVRARSEIVYCATNQRIAAQEFIELPLPPQSVNGILCIRSLAGLGYTDFGVDHYPYRIRKPSETGASSGATLDVTVLSPIVAPDVYTYTIPEQPDATRTPLTLPWTDLFAGLPQQRIDFELVVGDMDSINTTAFLFEPVFLDVFTTRPGGLGSISRLGVPLSRPQFQVPYTLSLDAIVLASGTLNVNVVGVFSPLRVSSLVAADIPVKKGVSTLIQLFSITDPDENEYNVGVHVKILLGTMRIFFKSPLNDTRITQRGCPTNYRILGCGEFVLVGPADLLNALETTLFSRSNNGTIAVSIFKPSPLGVTDALSANLETQVDPDERYLLSIGLPESDGSSSSPTSSAATYLIFITFIVPGAAAAFCLMTLCAPCLLWYAFAADILAMTLKLLCRRISFVEYMDYLCNTGNTHDDETHDREVEAALQPQKKTRFPGNIIRSPAEMKRMSESEAKRTSELEALIPTATIVEPTKAAGHVRFKRDFE